MRRPRTVRALPGTIGICSKRSVIMATRDGRYRVRITRRVWSLPCAGALSRKSGRFYSIANFRRPIPPMRGSSASADSRNRHADFRSRRLGCGTFPGAAILATAACAGCLRHRCGGDPPGNTPQAKNLGARSVTAPRADSRRRRTLRGPSDATAYPALAMSARPTRELSIMLFIGTPSPSARQRQGHTISDKGSGVGQAEHVRRHDNRVSPGIGFALDRGEGRQALGRKHIPGEQRQRGRQTP